MIEKIYWILEILTVIVCLYNYYDKKVKIDIYTAGFIAIDLIFMQLMQDNLISRKIYFLIYVIFILYAYIEFKERIMVTLFRSALSILTVGVLQMVIYIPFQLVYMFINKENIIVAFVSLTTLLVAYLTRNCDIYRKFSEFCLSKEWMLKTCLVVCTIFLGYCMYQIKYSEKIRTDIYIIVFTSIIVIGYIVLKWQKVSYEAKRRESQLALSSIYDESLKELIETTRHKQHEFNNHLNAIYGMCMTTNSYDELVQRQKEYCDTIVMDNRFIKILNRINNPALAGFVYSKISKTSGLGIDITYDVSVLGDDLQIDVFDLNEIIGIIFDNAVEAVQASELEKAINFELFDDERQIRLCIKNRSKKLTYSEIEKFFGKGYSSKGKDRGIGLYKIKEFQKKYKYDILVEMCYIDNQDWLSFSIIKKKKD